MFFSLQVALWSEKDVQMWVNSIGFAGYAKAFSDLRVDGDLLLQLDDHQLKEDVGITNSILRKRFIRELTQLKRNADYSAQDIHRIVPKLLAYKPKNSGSIDLMVYAYALIKADISPTLAQSSFSEEYLGDFLKESVHIKSYIHRRQVIDAIFAGSTQSPKALKRQPQYSSCASIASTKSHDSGLTYNSYDVYVSGGGGNGSYELASLIVLSLQLRGFSVHHSNLGNECNVFNSSMEDLLYNDDDDAETSLLLRSYSSSMERAKHFVLVLGPGALDDLQIHSTNQTKKHLYYVVAAALKAKNVNIVPVVAPGFKFPNPDDLLPEICALCSFNVVTWVHDYQDACVDKIERFMRGESFLRSAGSHTDLACNRIDVRTPIPSRSGQDSRTSTPTKLLDLLVNGEEELRLLMAVCLWQS